LTVQQKFLVLRTLAAHMTKLRISDIMPEAAKRVIAALLKRMRVGRDNVEAFLHGVLDSGILQEVRRTFEFHASDGTGVFNRSSLAAGEDRRVLSWSSSSWNCPILMRSTSIARIFYRLTNEL
jgi:hypothetical protein